MKLIIFDFEIFYYDTLLGYIILDNDNAECHQTWSLDEIRQFYNEHIDDIWIGHNNARYDNLILQYIVNNKNCTEYDIKEFSNSIIDAKYKPWLDIKLYYYDCMTAVNTSLKKTEAIDGKNISETEVDFRINRPLTKEEKRLTEKYNVDDLLQTKSNFLATKGTFMLRLQIISEFNLSMNVLHMTEAQIAETVLHAKKTPGIENWVLKPFEYPQLRLNNEKIKNFFFSEEFKTGKKLVVDLCGVPHTFGIGGLHAAQNKKYCDWAFYFDVSGYYNLVMINYDLLPRSIDEDYKDLYPTMYKQQLEFKKTAPEKRGAYKTILLSVFGAMFNEHCKFYDPYKAALVTMTGQLFIADLLEKLEGKVDLIQTNTDGVIAKPLPGVSDEEVTNIINEWQLRTGFVLKLEKIYNIYQRDVNCYCYTTVQEPKTENDIHVRGDLKHFWAENYVYTTALFNAKEPAIISIALVNYLVFKKLPEETIREKAHILRLYQFVCSTGTYDWLEYREIDEMNNVEVKRVQHINRAFPMISSNIVGKLYKMKSNGRSAIVSNMPESCFVYNNEVISDEAFEKIHSKIDWQYYVDRTYERIKEFIAIPTIKDVRL